MFDFEMLLEWIAWKIKDKCAIYGFYLACWWG